MSSFTEWVAETFQSVTGYEVVPQTEISELRERSDHFGEIENEAEDLALNVMDYIGARPHERTVLHRRRYAEKSRIAFIHDPLAGAEANLRANFAFGRGISKPQAADPDVQKIIDRAWDDPINQHKLTSFEAQRHRSNELLTTANLFATFFTKNGRVVVGFLDSDLVTDVVTDPEDEELPLWYVVRKRRSEWDFKNHQPSATLGYQTGKTGTEKVWYFEHFQFVQQLRDDAEEMGRPKPPEPDPGDISEGKVAHVRINRVGRTQFGIPPWTRTMRFMSALNQLTEAQVAMAQGRASIIAKRVRKGGPSQILKAAGNFLNRDGAIGAAKFGAGKGPENAGPGTDPQQARAPMPAGSHWLENESDTLQAVNLSSGASQAAQDAQIVRAPIAAAAGFGQHYLGDGSNASLASATSLELPTLMDVSAWQETFEGLYRTFTDYAIEEAVKFGELGGAVAEADASYTRPLRKLRLAEDQAEMEERTGKDLSYTFDMPYPGRRNLPDVLQAVTTVAAAYDPQGGNRPLRRRLLNFFATHGLNADDPAKWVDEVMPEEDPNPIDPAAAEPQVDPATGLPAAGTEQVPDDQQSQNGEIRRSQPPGREMGGPPGQGLGEEAGHDFALLEMLDEAFDTDLTRQLRQDVTDQFKKAVNDPASILAGRKPTPTGEGTADGATTATPIPE